ncbi:aminotransferase class III-fold pyridoxal phosphate-dependent enzyme [Bradyrhizobium guangdongense]|uniref:aminotransferase class III-fold pyridoxal phosphate-dependent enzyme n=1 Tax=Bradyrhizobium guangdongense TaxID=1325090 RepID=UPI0024BF96E1|nr:aminotransferase class III-fold pyridoxal phosphate-dependent enzyme [Bradyrhizobium guangdongense]
MSDLATDLVARSNALAGRLHPIILDEVPSCLGRTGTMFVCEQTETAPDILVLGKGLGGGIMPMAAILARADLDVVPEGALGH